MSHASGTQYLGAVPICIAIDKSGSTFRRTLEIERGAVLDICQLRLSTNKKPIRLLPWCDEVLEPIDLPDDSAAMNALVGRGGTDPSVLYSSEVCIEAIRSCGAWFLLTDGQIHDNLVEMFALKTAELGLHNKPCIIIVFDDIGSGPPAKCNISVGIATYAVVPDCLFLFHDRDTGIVRIMQVKGRFKELLPMVGGDRLQPVITKYTTWAELPRISYEDLSRVQIASIRPLARDEVALQDGLVAKLDDVLAGKADSATIEKIVEDDDNLKSIVLASMTRGTGKDLEAWLQAQQKPLPAINRDRHDADGKAQQSVVQLLKALQENKNQGTITKLRVELRSAHNTNRQLFKEHRKLENESYSYARSKNQKIRNVAAMHSWQRVNAWSNRSATWDINRQDAKDMRLERIHDDSNKLDPVFLPGFQGREPIIEFRGRCMLCYDTALLAILLKVPPNVTTSNFPRVGGYAKLAFPFAMGNLAEMDLLSFFVCCDSCAYYLQRNSASPHSEKITHALCLICINDNQASWLEVLDTAFKGRFDIPDLMSIFIAILHRKAVENNARDADIQDKRLFQDCVEWAIRYLAQIVEVPETLSLSFSRTTDKIPKVPLVDLLSLRGFADPGQPENVDLLLLRYPVAGFTVLLRLLQIRGVVQEQVQTLIFQRVLFHILEQYFARRACGASELFIEEILGREDPDRAANSSTVLGYDAVYKLPLENLLSHQLVDVESLSAFRGMAEFSDIENRSRPAMAVFLHHLLRYGGLYTSPVGCFNALKVSSSVRRVILAPLAISPGLSADLVSQL